MTELLIIMFSNALLTLPFAIVVGLAARWIKRPAVVHALWIIVLLKLLSPNFYQVSVPGLSGFGSYFLPAPELDRVEQGFAADFVDEVPVLRTNRQAIPSPGESSADFLVPTDRQSVGSISVNESPAIIVRLTDADERPSSSFNRGVIRGVLFLIWGAGAAFFFTMLAYRAHRFHQFVSRAPLASASIQSTARSVAERYNLRVTPTIRVAAGDFPPLLWVLPGSASIVLPRKLLSRLNPVAIRNLLGHELAHFARGDHWVRLLESMVLGIYWWHPLVWWARRQLQHAEEQCCDAWVLWAYPKSNTEYARTLLATLEYLSGAQSALPPLASGLGRANLIRRRFDMILHHKSPRKLSAVGMAITAAVALAILPWSASVVAQTQDAPPTATEAAQDSDLDAEQLNQRSPKRKQRKQKQRLKQQKAEQLNQKHQVEQQQLDETQQYNTQASELTSPGDKSADVDDAMRRLIDAAVRRALRAARGGSQHAPARVPSEVPDDVAHSLKNRSKSEWLRSLTDTLEAMEGISPKEIGEIAEEFGTAMEHFTEAVEKSAQTFGRALQTQLEASDEQLEAVDKDERPSRSGALSRVLRAVESAGIAKEEIRHVVDAVDATLDNVHVDVELRNEVDDDTNLKSSKEKVDRDTNRALGRLDKTQVKRRKLPKKQVERRDAQLEAIRRQIESLVKQLEELEEQVESDADATSTRR